MDNKFKPGLLELTPDSRDFSLGAITKLPKLEELPENFYHNPLEIKNQFNSDFCAAFSSCAASELQEGVNLSPEYQFALIKEIIGGDVDSFGADLRSAMKSFVKVGSIKKSDCPFTINQKDPSFLRRIENYPPELKQKALVHAKNTYVAISGQYDHFDNIRASIWLFREKKRVPVFGVRWGWPLDNPIVQNITIGGEGHALYSTGWRKIGNETYLVVPNSYGEGYGEKGYFYFSREVINQYVSIYGTFVFIDLTPEEYLARAEQMKLGILGKILEAIKKILSLQWLFLEEKKTEPIPEPIPEPKPEPIPEPKVSKLISWAKAIEIEEGSKPPKITDRNKRNNNPGNMRASDLVQSLGSNFAGYVNQDKDGFAIFSSYESGFKALCQFLTLAAEDKLWPYHNFRTLYLFTKRYAEPPNDNYANNVAKKLSVSVNINLKDLI